MAKLLPFRRRALRATASCGVVLAVLLQALAFLVADLRRSAAPGDDPGVVLSASALDICRAGDGHAPSGAGHDCGQCALRCAGDAALPPPMPASPRRRVAALADPPAADPPPPADRGFSWIAARASAGLSPPGAAAPVSPAPPGGPRARLRRRPRFEP